jgi:hypothetical protein
VVVGGAGLEAMILLVGRKEGEGRDDDVPRGTGRARCDDATSRVRFVDLGSVEVVGRGRVDVLRFKSLIPAKALSSISPLSFTNLTSPCKSSIFVFCGRKAGCVVVAS